MEPEIRKSKLETNREILQNLLRKKGNLELQIENLQLRIKNQEKARTEKKLKEQDRALSPTIEN